LNSQPNPNSRTRRPVRRRRKPANSSQSPDRAASSSPKGSSTSTPVGSERAQIEGLAFEPAEHDPTPVEFTTLGLDERLLQALTDHRFVRTTPVQSAVFPIVFSGVDLVACAQTGTGKTAAFLLPLLQRMLTEIDEADAEGGPGTRKAATRVLILAPTRELAVQIEEDFSGLAYHTPLSGVAVYGGVGAGAQDRALRAHVDVVVATPGRLMDHLNSGAAKFSGLDVLILDEADRMLDMGFWPDVRRIVSMLPVKRQTLLFSATMSNEVLRSAAQIMNKPKVVQIGRTGGPATTITHQAHIVPMQEKAAWLATFLRRAHGPSIVFTRTKHGADRLARRLAAAHIRCATLHADRSQSERTAAIEGFRAGKFRVLVATDIAARGIDIERIGQVINYDVPGSADSYVHRVGRTGRAEETGHAITLVAPEEMKTLKALEKSLKIKLLDPSSANGTAPVEGKPSTDAATADVAAASL
jgi:ATP-dependent RNA helicase RhlE